MNRYLTLIIGQRLLWWAILGDCRKEEIMLTKLKKLVTQPVFLSSAIATALLFGIQRLGIFQPVELKLYDQMTQIRSDSGKDSRILVVTVTEKDLQKLQQWPLSGEVLDRLFTKLEQYQPRAIGLDIFRDLRVEPGHDKLLKHLQQSDQIISVCKHSDAINPATPPPAGTQPDQVGFSDVVVDPDDIVRRSLLLVPPDSTSPCKTPYSLGLQLALKYLGNIQPKFTSQGELQLNKTVLKRLHSNSGGYQGIDAHGYQILLNYRSANNAVQQVSVSDVLSNHIDPNLLKDRVILIGTTAPSIRDNFNTPYSSTQQDNPRMPGVVLQSQMVSQILSTVLNQQPQFWFLPEWGGALWIWFWTLGGGILAWRVQHPLRLGLAGGLTLLALLGINFFLFIHAGWIPVVPPTLGLVLAIVSIVAYNAFNTKQEQQKIAHQVQEQEKTIALLQAMLKEAPSVGLPETALYQENDILNRRYKIVQPLGAGGFGKTYVAEDTQRPGNPPCVVKQLLPARQDSQFLEIARRLFKTEAEILELLGKHEQIPQLLAYFEENHQFYLVQEFIQGHCLTEEIKYGTRLSEAQVIELLQDVLQVLVFVHSHLVIHRDIKPGNLIRRERDQHLVLIDFGAVKQIQSQQQYEENQSIAIGTAGYSPPEQLMGQPKLNSDIYALGMIGIQALTGVSARKFHRDPNTGKLVFQLKPDTDRLLWSQLAETSENLAAILNRMVAYDFAQRYQSAQEVLQSLKHLSQE
jgi:CHASE2 domain-containing sensor protein/predicted Ser/Thr protein kinase